MSFTLLVYDNHNNYFTQRPRELTPDSLLCNPEVVRNITPPYPGLERATKSPSAKAGEEKRGDGLTVLTGAPSCQAKS